jgi:ribosomal-protein-alanine N-acetyltransferase
MTCGEIEVYQAGEADKVLLAKLHDLAFEGHGGDRWSPEAVSRILVLPGTRALIAVRTDSAAPGPLGFSIYGIAADECEIISLGVIPTGRKQGVGSLLLTRLLADSERAGAATAYLEVAQDNVTARAFYRVRGFVECGRRRNYYNRGEGRRVDACVLSRRLAPAR